MIILLVLVSVDEKLVYEKMMTFLYEENSGTGSQDNHAKEEENECVSDSVHPTSYARTGDLFEEMEEEETLPYIECFDKEVQDEIIVLDNLLLEQVRMENSCGSDTRWQQQV
uniref:Uncharacterized protein n=1 Tax=Sphaerodactylus townsendi TaxID=933632 RepID=A0ACB8FC66_9SAUR